LAACIAALLVLGTLILSSASATLAQTKFNNSYYLLVHQLTRGILPGLILGFVAYKLSIEKSGG